MKFFRALKPLAFFAFAIILTYFVICQWIPPIKLALPSLTTFVIITIACAVVFFFHSLVMSVAWKLSQSSWTARTLNLFVFGVLLAMTSRTIFIPHTNEWSIQEIMMSDSRIVEIREYTISPIRINGEARIINLRETDINIQEIRQNREIRIYARVDTSSLIGLHPEELNKIQQNRIREIQGWLRSGSHDPIDIPANPYYPEVKITSTIRVNPVKKSNIIL